MKRKLSTSLFAVLLLLGTAFVGTSCSKSDIPLTSDKFTVTVRATDWSWIAETDDGLEGYYRVSVQAPKLTNYIAQNAVVAAYQVSNTGVYTLLPYLKSYGYDKKYDDGTVERDYYTEAISFDFAAGEVFFYLESSDLAREDEYLINRTFEVRMAW